MPNGYLAGKSARAPIFRFHRSAQARRVGAIRQRLAMPTLAEAAKDFLAQQRLAFVGVSRDSRQPANFNFRRLRDAGRLSFACVVTSRRK